MLHTSARREECRVDQEQQDGQQQKPRWQPTRKQLLWAGGITTLAFLLIVICGYLFGWKWTGLPKKTLWDYLELLIVPAALALGVYWLNRRQEERGREADAERERYRQAQEARREHEREADAAQREREREAAEEGRRQRELEVESQRAQDAALQAYLDQMSQLLLDKDKPLRHSKEDDEVRTLAVRTLARARTLTVLRRLDGARKASVLQFLYESGLIYKEETSFIREANVLEKQHNIISLEQADLSGAHLRRVHMFNADLSRANLSGANLTEEQLTHARSLDGATMPDGQTLRGGEMPNGPTFEDWLKSKDHPRENVENE
jgi:hypothetical protein